MALSALASFVADPSSALVALEKVIKELWNVQVAKYLAVASLCFFFYDYFLTLAEEISLVWTSAIGIPKILFFWNRYFTFVDVVLLAFLITHGSGPVCTRLFQVTGAFSALGFVAAQLILMMRTWAIWERRKSIAIFFAAILAACIGIDAFVLRTYLGGVTYIPSPSPAIQGCLLSFKSRIIYVDFIMVMTTESVMLTLLVTKALQHFRHSRSRIMVGMYREGIIFFACILVVSIANVVVIITAPIELHNSLIVVQRVLHSVFCSRILLHIRGAYSNDPLKLENLAFEQQFDHTSFDLRQGQQNRVTYASVVVANGNIGSYRGWGQGNGFDTSNAYLHRSSAFDNYAMVELPSDRSARAGAIEKDEEPYKTTKGFQSHSEMYMYNRPVRFVHDDGKVEKVFISSSSQP